MHRQTLQFELNKNSRKNGTNPEESDDQKIIHQNRFIISENIALHTHKKKSAELRISLFLKLYF